MNEKRIDLESKQNGKESLDLLMMVEDEKDHAELVIDALREVGNIKSIVLFENGETALKYIFRQGRYSDKALSPRPALILLDMNLPGKSGLEVLRDIRADNRFTTIPVVMLTTSSSTENVQQTAELGANDYVVKPVDFGEFLTTITELGTYWSTVSALPLQRGLGND